MSDLFDLFQSAIGARHVLAVHYFPGDRIIEPHAFGYGSAGQLLLRAYQTEGASASGEHEWWKLFRLDRFEWAKLAGAAFAGPRPEYRRGDKAMRGGIICEL